MKIFKNRRGFTLVELIVVLVIYWLATFIALKGLTWVGKISKIGGMIGTIIPAGLLIVLGITIVVNSFKSYAKSEKNSEKASA